jgi:thiol-disulfide isomerase/thioredoxin
VAGSFCQNLMVLERKQRPSEVESSQTDRLAVHAQLFGRSRWNHSTATGGSVPRTPHRLEKGTVLGNGKLLFWKAHDHAGRQVCRSPLPSRPRRSHRRAVAHNPVTDDFEGMKVRAAYKHFDFPYLYDGATQSVAQAYGPKATPHVFLFDKDRKLRYEGRIDDNQRESLVNTRDARAALDALLAGKPIEKASTPVFGCSTKWKSKIDNQLAELQKIESQPVNVEMVSAAGLKALRANSSDKVLLVNFWATWCGPCVTELPDLQTTYRMFKNRDFDMVTVATNMPDEKTGVLKTLQAQRATGRNLLFDSTDTYAMQAAFDAHWDSGVPFTMVIAPGGKVLYQHQGDIDIIDLRRAILPHLEDETFKGHPGYWAKNLRLAFRRSFRHSGAQVTVDPQAAPSIPRPPQQTPSAGRPVHPNCGSAHFDWNCASPRPSVPGVAAESWKIGSPERRRCRAQGRAFGAGPSAEPME